MESYSWRGIYEQFAETWRVFFGQRHPQHISTYYNRIQLSVLWHYPNTEQRRLFIRRVWHVFDLIQLDVFFITMCFALPESFENIVDFGQDLLWMIGTFYLVFKWHYYYFNMDRVDEVIDALDEFHRESRSGPVTATIRAEQRFGFLIECSLGLIWHVGITVFLALAVSQPFWTNQKLPFHAVCPFQWHDPKKHPIAHAIIYLWQCFIVIYNLLCVQYSDLGICHCFFQLGINLKILSLELKELGTVCHNDTELFRRELGRLIATHQRIIRLVVHSNDVFYGPFIMQLLALFLMISLSTFEALVARHDPPVAARFIIFMLLAFCHLTYWCLFGDMVTEQSQLVATAAYEAYEWSPRSTVIQRDIMFIIQRSQKPLYMGSAPFPPFNLFSCMAILKQCYSILTLLLESLD